MPSPKARTDSSSGLIALYKTLGGGWQGRRCNHDFPLRSPALRPSPLPSARAPRVRTSQLHADACGNGEHRASAAGVVGTLQAPSGVPPHAWAAGKFLSRAMSRQEFLSPLESAEDGGIRRRTTMSTPYASDYPHAHTSTDSAVTRTLWGRRHRRAARPQPLDAAGAVVTAAVVTAAPSADRESRPGAVLAVLSPAAFMASLDLFIVNVAFPEIGRNFAGASLSDLSWVLNGYAVLYAALLVPLGRLADRYGRMAGFLGGLALFTIASAACAASPNLWSLVAFRGLQAVGAAALTPTSLGLLLAATPAERRGPPPPTPAARRAPPPPPPPGPRARPPRGGPGGGVLPPPPPPAAP